VSDVVLVRCIIQIIIFTSIIFYSRDRLLPANSKMKLLTLSQGFFGAISFITSLASVSFMPVPDALCIIFACPVVTIVLSAILLGDKLNSLKCFSGTILLLGVVLVCQPPFLFHLNSPLDNQEHSSYLLDSHDSLYYVGVALAATACVTGGLMDVLVAKCEGVSTPVLVNWAAISGLIISISYSLLQSTSRILSPDIYLISSSDWLILTGLAVSGLLAFTSLTKALKLISPNIVSSLRALELVLAFIVQTVITGATPDIWSCFGGGLVFSGVLILTFQKKIYKTFCKEVLPVLPPEIVSQTSSSQPRQEGLDEYSRLYG